ncbi:uncharacterized protein FTOL_05244 [Fusarium torulosum]|uniref:Uncharacterized protein n=1 Tax=Fusarium torulosum TaxID=33205 RepID=A0AAE8M790_9HYPO|nr:uncharacterized protein FTOL_05244 [Fusarium torulosum]
MSMKYANILAAEGEIHKSIDGEYRTICGFELIKMHLGQNCNRYPRTRVSWTNQDDKLVTREGHFYSAVAQYLMKNVTDSDEFPGDSLSNVAIRWKPELQELKFEMIKGTAPVLEDGVELDPHRPNKADPSSDVAKEYHLKQDSPALWKGWEDYRLDAERAKRI